MISNSLKIPSMETNLVPPFIMREPVIQLNYNPNIQVKYTI